MPRSEDPKDTLEEKMFSGWEGLAKAVILRAADGTESRPKETEPGE